LKDRQIYFKEKSQPIQNRHLCKCKLHQLSLLEDLTLKLLLHLGNKWSIEQHFYSKHQVSSLQCDFKVHLLRGLMQINKFLFNNQKVEIQLASINHQMSSQLLNSLHKKWLKEQSEKLKIDIIHYESCFHLIWYLSFPHFEF